MLEVEDVGRGLDVAVVVQDRRSVSSGQPGGQQVGDADRSMAPGPSHVAVGFEGTLASSVVRGQ